MAAHPQENIDQLAINTIRTLSMDAVQQAKSGHPGTPMAMAPVAYTLWQRFLRFDPDDPIWPNRDRFVLSAGHASMLLYSVLHLAGVKSVNSKYERLDTLAVSLDDIRHFRQLDSKCPGHPEYRWTSGVETTTGPLGQGAGNSVGMAVASRWLAAHFNRPGFEMFNYDVYALCGDGDMMEGISGEAASLAGHLKLSNLCWIYDSNRITIEGHTDLAFSEDVATRFTAYGWNVMRVSDANDLERLTEAFASFKATPDRPTFIIVDSHIAYGAPNKQDTAAAHGEPLGDEEVKLAKRAYGWPEDEKFLVPDGVRERFAEGVGARGRTSRTAWLELFERYRTAHPELAAQLSLMQHRELPQGWDANLPVFPADKKGVASRDASGTVLNVLAKNTPWLLGGAADLAPSTKTLLKAPDAGDLNAANAAGRNMHFGVREHAMGAIVNGLSLSKIRAFGATFLIFSDYMRPAIRLSALMELPAIYRVHARFDRRRRRRPHASADRATGGAAGNSGSHHVSSGGRERGRRGVAGDHAASSRAGRDRPQPPAASDLRSIEGRRSVWRRPRRIRPGRLESGQLPTSCSWPLAARCRCVLTQGSSSRPRAFMPGSSACRRGRSSSSSPRSTATRCCRPR